MPSNRYFSSFAMEILTLFTTTPLHVSNNISAREEQHVLRTKSTPITTDASSNMRNRHKAKKTRQKHRPPGRNQVTDPNPPTTPVDTARWDEMASKLHADARSFTPSPTPIKQQGGDAVGESNIKSFLFQHISLREHLTRPLSRQICLLLHVRKVRSYPPKQKIRSQLLMPSLKAATPTRNFWPLPQSQDRHNSHPAIDQAQHGGSITKTLSGG
jgi:hypothetical protein